MDNAFGCGAVDNNEVVHSKNVDKPWVIHVEKWHHNIYDAGF